MTSRFLPLLCIRPRRRFGRRLASMLFCLLAAASAARAGGVWTLDGKTYEGQTSLLESGQIAVAAPGAAPVHLPLADVLYVSFAPPTPAPADTAYLGPLSAQSIGQASRAEAVFTRGFYSIRGDGAVIGGAADDFHFFSQGLFGDSQIAVRVTEVASAKALAGVMFRESAKPDARHVSLLVNAAGELSLRSRAEPGQETVIQAAGKVAFPIHLRLVRADSRFSASQSADGINWTPVSLRAAASQPAAPSAIVNIPTGALAGLAFVGGPDDAAACFDQLQIHEETAQQTPQAALPAARYRVFPREFALPGVLLRTGTFFAGATLAGNSQAGYKIACDGPTYPIDLAQICRFQKESLSPGLLAHLPPRASGIVLASGDFMEGRITAFENDQIEISNIIAGLLRYSLRTQVQAIAFRNVDTAPAGFRVQLTDGSVLLSRSLSVAPSADWLLDEHYLGAMNVSPSRVLSLQGAADRVVSLLSLQPRLDAPRGADVEALTCFDRGGAFWLSPGGTLTEQGVVAPAGAVLTYRLPAGCRLFSALIGVPDRLPERAAVRFVLIADGKEIFRSPVLTSRQPPLPISVRLETPGTLTLRVENAQETPLSAFGLWANPFLVHE